MTWKEIAKECGVSREWLSSSGACKGFEPLRGYMNEDRYKEALLLREQGLTWKSIAKQVGVSTPTLRKWINENKKSNFI